MAENLFPVVRRLTSWLVCWMIFLIIIHPFPAQAHIAIPEKINEITRLIHADPEAPTLYLLRGDLYRIHGHWSEAIADFCMVQKLEPNNAVADIGMGRTYFDQGAYRKAIKYLNHALTIQPSNVRTLSIRAKAFRLLGEPLATIADYKRIIHSFKVPKNPLPEYYFELARAFEAAGMNYFGAALESLDKGISRLGQIRLLEDYAIKLERKRQHYNAALLRLDGIISRSVRKEALLMRRGEILLEAERPAEAQVDFIAAREAIDALPIQRRHSKAIKQLRTDVEDRIYSLESLR